ASNGRRRRPRRRKILRPLQPSRSRHTIIHRPRPPTAMHDASLPHEFQYSSASHQEQSAIAGMWLFLATEVLFFGALFLAWIYARHFDQPGFDAGAQQTNLVIGTANTVILITSSVVYSAGVMFIEAGNGRRLIQCCTAAALLGLSFL